MIDHRRILAVVIASATLATLGCSEPGPSYLSPERGRIVSPHEVRLHPNFLSVRQAKRDAQLALYRGDKSLLGTGERDPTTIPGAPANWREEDWRFGVRTIEDTEVQARDAAHARFYQKAVRYAEAYNRFIFSAEPMTKYRRRPDTGVQRALADDRPRSWGPCQNSIEFRIGQLSARRAPAEARRHSESGMTILLAVQGYSMRFPGATSADIKRMGCLGIEGTSDNAIGDGGFNDAADDFARAWNVEMLRLNPAPQAAP